jgi:hypothetical protein
MLKLDRQAFGGLGAHVKLPIEANIKQVDLHTGDAVIAEGKGVFVHRRRLFSWDARQAAVASAVVEMRKADPEWRITAYPALQEWLRYEVFMPEEAVAAAPVADTTPTTTEPEAAAAEEAPAQGHKKSKKKVEPC